MENEFEQNNGSNENQNVATNQTPTYVNTNTEYTGENPFFNLNDYYQNQQQTYTQNNEVPYDNNQYTNQNYSNVDVNNQQYYGNQEQAYSPYTTSHREQEEHVFQINQMDDGKKNKKGKKVFGFIAKAAVFGLIAGAVFIGTNEIYYQINPDSKQTETVTSDTNTETKHDSKQNSDAIETTKVTNTGAQAEANVADVVDSTMPSIVAITSTMTQSYNDWFGQNYSKDVQGSGSGFIIGKNDKELLIATNNHVVADAKAIAVQFIDEKIYQATIKGTDSTADLAVVAIKLSDISKESMNAIKIATLGNSDATRVGEKVIAIGNALGYGQSITVGYVSAKDREVTTEKNKMKLLQTDAAINPGNSGGALLNMKGEVIGINSIKYTDQSVEGMGFAIPISHATPIIDELKTREKINKGEEGFLGIQGRTVDEEMIKTLNMVPGVYINNVYDGPAEKAGILPRDILTKINGTDVTTIESVIEKISSYRAGTTVSITYQRLDNGEYKEHTVDVKLSKKSDIKTDSEDEKTTKEDTEDGMKTPDEGEKQKPEDNQQDNPFSDFFDDPFFGFGN